MSMALLLFFFFSYFTDNKIFHIIITLITIIFYGIYLVYDTQLIAGAHKYSLEIDDYIIGAMILYVDIITLFLEIVRLLNLFMDDKQALKFLLIRKRKIHISFQIFCQAPGKYIYIIDYRYNIISSFYVDISIPNFYIADLR